MMKVFFQLIFLFWSCNEKPDLVPIACGTDDPVSDIEWIGNLVTEFQANQSPSSIELYSYKGQKMYLVSHCNNCPDALKIAYDCEQNEVCKFGGIAGINTCPDFENNAVYIETIFEK